MSHGATAPKRKLWHPALKEKRAFSIVGWAERSKAHAGCGNVGTARSLPSAALRADPLAPFAHPTRLKKSGHWRAWSLKQRHGRACPGHRDCRNPGFVKIVEMPPPPCAPM